MQQRKKKKNHHHRITTTSYYFCHHYQAFHEYIRRYISEQLPDSRDTRKSFLAEVTDLMFAPRDHARNILPILEIRELVRDLSREQRRLSRRSFQPEKDRLRIPRGESVAETNSRCTSGISSFLECDHVNEDDVPVVPPC